MWLAVPVDRPTATEAIEAARQVQRAELAISLGPELLLRSGAPVVAALQEFGPVFADARVSGGPRAVVGGARHLAAAGARWVTVDARIGPDGVEETVRVVHPYGARVVLVWTPPEFEPDPSRRGEPSPGRQLSRAAAGVAALDVDVLVGLSDVGVVVQSAPELGVVVAGVEEADVEEARRRGASGVILAAGPGPQDRLERLGLLASTD